MKQNLLEIKKQINDLVNKINKWNKEYFVDNDPSVSDEIYDKALLELEKLEEKYPEYISPNSPTQVLGAYVDNKFKKVVHQKPMLSLSKAYSYDEIEKYIDNLEKFIPIEEINFSIEPKIDGLSISLHYENGYLKQAVTRGDGLEGEDVTDNIRAIKSIPQVLDFQDKIEVRGEVFMPKDRFQQLNAKLAAKGEKTFANPRNAASGTLRQLDSNIVEARGLEAYLYEIVEPEKYQITYQKDALEFLKKLNLPTNPYSKFVEIEELAEAIENFAELKNTFNYDADGLVIKLNNLTYWDKLGRTAKFPKHSIAFKYEVEKASSTILGIKATVGRTGKITYVANLAPVELNQTTVQNATLHNYNFIENLKIDIGDNVVIVKAGEIIPKIIDNLDQKENTNYQKVLNCPSCGMKLVEFEGNIDQFCINKKCPDIIMNSIIHFASRKSMNIVGLGESTVKDLYKIGLLTKISDIFELKNHKDKILALPRYGELKVNNLLNNIKKAKNANFAKVMFAIGVNHLGERAAKIFSEYYANFAELINDSNLTKVSGIMNIGPKIIESVSSYLKNPDNWELLQRLDQEMIYQNTNKTAESDKLKDLIFVITGKLNNPRDHYQDLIEKNGGKVASSISSKTSFLLLGEDAGSKLEKAKKLNVKIINEQDFLQMIGR
ncbi:NAD-dependent DNA ligase LigA [Mycoplasmopsis iners]|uniref:NAD-dependent DNA ligase LigA n=1 Tax=Mycoplasmopsis iners TaxID=76630 RepID=UPI0004952262|nr:NAD-dependent DNA ligase LigA [Mycoplasmopsis iners]